MSVHWDERYRSSGAEGVSWYQAVPVVSLELIDALSTSPAAAVVDVGGGASVLVDHLIARGHGDVTVVDVSPVALATTRARLGHAHGVSLVQADLLAWDPPRRWDLWHDRAVLHFLTDDADRAAYVRLMRRSLPPGGAFVIGTFAPDGPTHCSGLPVRRHDGDDVVELLGGPAAVDVVAARREVHHTPGDADQPFTWVAGRLRATNEGPG
ncbi:class I SAM-dependent methyltransferase [Iamia sp. SCSIO 61187]|uniref:class I SAM-dependent methyltransferase n=1 Tax=Iamia sp. SCSIO 61187 TaxID=2722752 RepID=UPI001C62FF09|nr:class I SAM-dependent methyltransferase [Iamia sp. SCSIO 61187]QYG93231.1 class I SAM-dependent methyltransferase [Iamia sp. SCSIO 61187]